MILEILESAYAAIVENSSDPNTTAMVTKILLKKYFERGMLPDLDAFTSFTKLSSVG